MHGEGRVRMNAQPGWYDAGVPGRERWWDGTQWSAHERPTPTAFPAAPPAPATPQTFAAPQPAPVQVATAYGAPTGPAPGWYAMPGADEVRWWEGRWWTMFRIRAGRPGNDAFGAEQPSIALGLGVVFLVLGGAQFALSVRTGSFGPGFPLLVLGVLWILAGAQGSALRRKPAPTTAPLHPDVAAPFVGQQDGVGAGWYRVHRRASRWWTGTRWAPYVFFDRWNGIRPTLHGPRTVRTTRIVAWVLAGLGVIGLVGGILLLVAGAASSLPSTMTGFTVMGVAVLFFGLVLLACGISLLFMSRIQARILLIPDAPASAFPRSDGM